MTRPPCLAQHDAHFVAARFRHALTDAGPNLAAETDALLARISPPNWALEWSLPVWLGDALGLDRERSLALASANVLGLGYIRLQDDLYDADLSLHKRAVAIPLGVLLYERWTRVYVELLGAEVAFWNYFGDRLAEWVQAMLQSSVLPARPFSAWRPADFDELANRGAPLKICVAAACLLSGQPGRIGPFAAVVDDLLVAAVLLDHAQDWEADLAENRPNLFVAYCDSGNAGIASALGRRAVVQEWTIGQAGRAYFRLIEDRLTTAARRADAEGLQPLARFARWLRAQARRYRSEMAHASRTRLHDLAAGLGSQN